MSIIPAKNIVKSNLFNNIKIIENKNFKLISFGIVAFLFAFLIYFFFFQKTHPNQIAKNHFKKFLSEIDLTHTNNLDEFKQGAILYNQKQYQESIAYFDAALLKNNEDYSSLEAIGLAHLAINNYDIAFRYFSRMTNLQNVENNAGLFLQAIVFMYRDQEGDREEAKFFLNQVVKEKAKGTEFAESWLKKF